MALTEHEIRRIRRERDHLAMMRHPEIWPYQLPVPLLPLVNDKLSKSRQLVDRVLGFMIGGEGPKVYVGLMYQSSRRDKMPTQEFESYEAAMEAGWEVD